ncbi:response regulator transcription factor [Aliishimia ponticola]|uniref:Response regulator transcription factor n=1 Tax=Aliishimia ponticola TaxID=2499833 RepID=A0A4S4NCB3_9RHOB|nr:response regulator [Aliishimia ponticola]THH36107.1 response regulator transcription factor [Aliishimia ponticola]
MPDTDKSILLVEDEDNIALALEVIIGRRGFDTTRVVTGQEAIDTLATDRPDLVVLDVMLPERSGFEVCQHIRDTDRLSGVKVLMISATGSDMTRRKGLELGADAFLTKPFDTRELTDTICALLAEPEPRHA